MEKELKKRLKIGVRIDNVDGRYYLVKFNRKG